MSDNTWRIVIAVGSAMFIIILTMFGGAWHDLNGDVAALAERYEGVEEDIRTLSEDITRMEAHLSHEP